MYLPPEIANTLRHLLNACPEEFLAEYQFDPPPESKKRHDKWGSTPLATRSYEHCITEQSREQHDGRPFDRRMIMVAEFKVTHLRGDVSNMVKAIEDGMQHVVMSNDNLLDAIVAIRRKAEQPGSVVQLYEAAPLVCR